jgi:hypothetical protein
MGRLRNYDKWVRKMQTSLEAALFYKIEDFIEDFVCSNDFVEIVEGLIKEGEYDDAVHDRFTSALVDDFCADCENRCTDTCPGYRLRG